VDRELGRAVSHAPRDHRRCGFAGLFAADALRRAEVEVVVVDRTNHHLFQALPYQVATGVLSEADIAPPIRDVLRHHRRRRCATTA
jgi:NADH dehydrogenase